ncbi:MAG: xanthine dehydrogenase FAD-binding subunit XdhB [Eggerthellaceae bacterium]|nr:xanthine dehydrogenase FAD-binding subunit XdhB [Eggerthellaceae bacterium]MCH4221729.1 xanthine dehydrogenase FAD-binding subunit XdhB [Eggerthellaceae bacterium]
MYDIAALYEADTIDKAVRLRVEHPQAHIISGGSDVLVQIREGRRAGVELISLYMINSMRGVTIDSERSIRIGSLTSFSHITAHPLIKRHIPVLGKAVDMIGGPQVRNIGTIGGNTCNGVTSADSSSTLHAWDAIIELYGSQGIRRVPIKDFYLKAGVVDIHPDEIQIAVLIPQSSYERTFGHYIKYAMREAMDIATTGTSVNVRLSPDKRKVERARIAFGVAGPVPLRSPHAEARANNAQLSKDLPLCFAHEVLKDIRSRDSWRASKPFRQHIAIESARRAFIESVHAAGGSL